MARRTIDYRQTFALEDGWLVRTVVKPDGSSDQHRCSLASYRDVAHFTDERATDRSPRTGCGTACRTSPARRPRTRWRSSKNRAASPSATAAATRPPASRSKTH